MSELRFALLTTLILIGSYVTALNVSSLDRVLAYVGSTGSTSISFILPGLFYYKIADPNGPSRQKLLKSDDDEYDGGVLGGHDGEPGSSNTSGRPGGSSGSSASHSGGLLDVGASGDATGDADETYGSLDGEEDEAARLEGGTAGADGRPGSSGAGSRGPLPSLVHWMDQRRKVWGAKVAYGPFGSWRWDLEHIETETLRKLALALAIYGICVMVVCLIMNTFFVATH